MSSYMREGSGWTFDHIEQLEIHLNKFKPLRGSSYIPLPKPLDQKKAVIYVQNQDQECFHWAILSALHHEDVDKNCTKRVGQYKHLGNELKLDDIDFPVSINAIDKFERRNADLNINVFGYDGLKKDEDGEEDLQIYPQRISKNTGAQHVDLLFLTSDSKQHYCWIMSLSRLLSSQVPEHGHALFFCRRCLCHFSRQDIVDNHMEYCGKRMRSESRCRKKDPSLASNITSVR